MRKKEEIIFIQRANQFLSVFPQTISLIRAGNHDIKTTLSIQIFSEKKTNNSSKALECPLLKNEELVS